MSNAMVSGVAAMSADAAWTSDGALDVHDTPDGADALALAEAVRVRDGLIVYVARDASGAAAMATSLEFFAPTTPRLSFPAWDCLPYDRVSPSAAVSSARMATLGYLAGRDADAAPLFLITTVNAVLQRTPPIDVVKAAAFSAPPRRDDVDGRVDGLSDVERICARLDRPRAGRVRSARRVDRHFPAGYG